MAYTIRRCNGNRMAWGAFNLSRDPSDYGHCFMTAMSIGQAKIRLRELKR